MAPTISRRLLQRLQAIVEADPTREVCGLLMGRGGAIEAIAESANVSTEPLASFEIDPRVQIAAIKAARDGGWAVIGCYHSHPGGVARPSQRDLDMAQRNDLWLIFAGTNVTLWRRQAETFQQLDLAVRPA